MNGSLDISAGPVNLGVSVGSPTTPMPVTSPVVVAQPVAVAQPRVVQVTPQRRPQRRNQRGNQGFGQATRLAGIATNYAACAMQQGMTIRNARMILRLALASLNDLSGAPSTPTSSTGFDRRGAAR